jgi:DNA helicase-2/ATP-dependent DNA helicase PcrA
MPFTPSPFQQAIFDWVQSGTGSAIVRAVAGSGKTTTCIECLNLIPERFGVQMFAFNTTIAKELAERVSKLPGNHSNVRASTFHSVGFGAVRKKLGNSVKIEVDANKCRKLMRAYFNEMAQELYGTFASKLVGYAKGEGIGALVPDTQEAWRDLVRHHDLTLDSEDASESTGIEIARQLLLHSNNAAQEGLIDYDDQLYLVILWRLRLWQNDWIFVDEAQDTNPVRRAIAKLALRPGGRLVAVGDPNQAIYGFTGASADAMELIRKEFNCIELPLTVSYRCAQSVVRLAQSIVPDIQAFEGAPEGLVEHLPLQSTGATLQRNALDLLTAHDAVLCRNTAPLIQLAYQLIAKKRGCVILGREIGAGLTDLVKKMRAKGVDSLIEKLGAWQDREVAKFVAAGQEGKAEAVSDRVACILTVIDHLEERDRTVPALIASIESLFSDTNGVLTLCTAHKAKGKEWETVAVLRPDLMPSKWARQAWQAQQERNLMYVAWTRARRNLIFIEW